MSIPSDPNYLPPKSSNIPPPQLNQPEGSYPTSYVDPTGAWAKFISTPGNPASAEDVKMFMQGLLKFFGVLIKQEQDAAKRAADKLKRAAQGDE